MKKCKTCVHIHQEKGQYVYGFCRRLEKRVKVDSDDCEECGQKLPDCRHYDHIATSKVRYQWKATGIAGYGMGTWERIV